MNLLQIVEVRDVKEASDGRSYITVGFKSQKFMGNVPILSNEPVRYRNFWEEGPNGGKGDSLFHTAKKGALVEGSIHTRKVVPYEIVSSDGEVKEVDQYTLVKFPHENIVTAFKNAGHELVSEGIPAVTDDVELTSEEKAESPF